MLFRLQTYQRHIFQGRTNQIMKQTFKTIVSRGVAAVFLAALILSTALGSTAPASVTVSSEAELTAALGTAASSGVTTTITYASGVTSITLTTGTTIPSNAIIDLSTGGGTLRMESGTVNLIGTINGGSVEVAGAILAVYGHLSGGTATVSSGTLVRMSGCNITSGVSVPSGGTGAVRYETVLTLENLDSSSTETITAITYYGISDSDETSFIQYPANGTVFPLYGETISKVTTSAGNVFRLGTKGTGVLSLAYSVTYYGMTDATLTIANPTSYTASDSAVQLNNPTKDGYMFDGWTCDQLSLTVPTTTAVIPEGMTGALSFVANWTAQTMQGGGSGMSGGSGSSGSSSSSSTTTDDTETDETETATTEDVATDTTTTSSVRVGRGTSSTKVTFTSDVDEAIPTLESVQGTSFPWGWTLLGVGGSAILVYIIALINRKMRERADLKK